MIKQLRELWGFAGLMRLSAIRSIVKGDQMYELNSVLSLLLTAKNNGDPLFELSAQFSGVYIVTNVVWVIAQTL